MLWGKKEEGWHNLACWCCSLLAAQICALAGEVVALGGMEMPVVTLRLIPSVFSFCKSRSFILFFFCHWRFTDHLLIVPKSDAVPSIFDNSSEALAPVPPRLLFAAGSSDPTKFVKASGTSAAYDCLAMNQQNTLFGSCRRDAGVSRGLPCFCWDSKCAFLHALGRVLAFFFSVFLSFFLLHFKCTFPTSKSFMFSLFVH